MRTTYTWTLPAGNLELGQRTAVMAILNVTPDSFSDGGTYIDPAYTPQKTSILDTLNPFSKK